MTSIADNASIVQALHELQKENWLQHLDELVGRFSGFDYENCSRLSQDLEIALWDIVAVHQRSEHSPWIRLFHRRIAELECWLYRATRTSTKGEQQFWNPLEETYLEFKRGDDATHCYMADTGYPARDVVRKWCEQRLK